MLNTEQTRLMMWLRDQNRPISMEEMERLDAPGFARQRIEHLRADGYLNRGIDSDPYTGELTAVYTVSDFGKAKLEEQEWLQAKERKRTVQYIITTAIAVTALLLSLFSIGWQIYIWRT